MPAICRAVAVTLLSAVFIATYDSSIHAQGVKPATANAQSTQDIDRDVWSVFVATVAADDIVRMGEAYFPNAVVVMPNATSPIFKYTVIEKFGARTSKFYPFEALLGKTNGKWRVLMERQFAEVTQAEWDKLTK